MYKLRPTTKYNRDLKRMQKRGANMDKMIAILKKLQAGKKLEKKNKNHGLSGEYAGQLECHIEPDWLLIYDVDNVSMCIYLTRTGTHGDLFV